MCLPGINTTNGLRVILRWGGLGRTEGIRQEYQIRFPWIFHQPSEHTERTTQEFHKVQFHGRSARLFQANTIRGQAHSSRGRREQEIQRKDPYSHSGKNPSAIRYHSKNISHHHPLQPRMGPELALINTTHPHQLPWFTTLGTHPLAHARKRPHAGYRKHDLTRAHFTYKTRSHCHSQVEIYPRNPRIETLSESFWRGIFTKEVIIDLPFGFPINNIITLFNVTCPWFDLSEPRPQYQ